MNVLQNKVSDEHNSAMFYTGVIALGIKDNKAFCLFSHNAEIMYNNKKYIGKDIANIALSISDANIDNEVDELVDGWITIAEINPYTLEVEDVLHCDDQDESRIFDNYDDAIQAFLIFLSFLNVKF